MTNIQASLGLSQLKRINSIIKKRHEVGKIYFDFLKIQKMFIFLNQKKLFKKYLLGNWSSNKK